MKEGSTAAARSHPDAKASPPVVCFDSVTQTTRDCAGKVVVTGSHGGKSSASYATKVRAALYVFNDAGIGKDGAGVAALALLAEQGIAALTVDCRSARIGDARDTLENGMVSAVNEPAHAAGWREAVGLQDQLERARPVT